MAVCKLKHQVVQFGINPIQTDISTRAEFSLVNQANKTIRNKENANVKHIKYRVGLDMIRCRKPMKKNVCTCKQSSQMCSSPKLGNHWLVPMGAEVGASVANLQNARRVQHLADVCHQLVHMFIYTIQHISKNVCISLLEGGNVNRGMHIILYTHACVTAMPERCVD